ncbi:MAG: methyltransferase domain-containing protein, partial [Bacteroidaceae bacterium]|nr:methyltransferase domain-containing protein [Bacteroidaceae bacterium]
MANSSGVLRILDIGTGSGCIALALKHLLGERAKVEAWDLSEEALLIAQKNAESLGLDVHFEQHDILAPETYAGQFDIIVSNPPYVCQSESEEMERNVVEY